MSVTIYHNPRCSKSRQTVSMLEDKGISVDVIEYLKSPPDFETLQAVIKKLGLQPRQLLRKHEQAYKEAGLDDQSLSDDAIIRAMVENPILIERPIVINGDKAAIGRPPETVLKILD